MAGLNAWRGTMCYRLPAGSGRAGMVVVVALVRVCRFSSGCVAGGQSVVVWSCRLWGDQIFGYLSRCAGAGGSRSAGLVWSLLVPGARCLVWVGLLPSGHLGVALALVLPGRLDLLSLVVRAGLVLWFSALVLWFRVWFLAWFLLLLALSRALPSHSGFLSRLLWSGGSGLLSLSWYRLVARGRHWPSTRLDAPGKRPETRSGSAGNALGIARHRSPDLSARG